MSRSTLVVVLADTHLRDDLGRLPAEVWRRVERADLVLHAGDVVAAPLLDRLAALAPVHAVLGNNDDRELASRLPDRLDVSVDGVQIGLVHDSGARSGRERRLRRWFPTADVVVFGHSHEAVDTVGVDGQRLFNPGSAIQRRRQPHRSFGELRVRDGRLTAHRIVALGP